MGSMAGLFIIVGALSLVALLGAILQAYVRQSKIDRVASLVKKLDSEPEKLNHTMTEGEMLRLLLKKVSAMQHAARASLTQTVSNAGLLDQNISLANSTQQRQDTSGEQRKDVICI